MMPQSGRFNQPRLVVRRTRCGDLSQGNIFDGTQEIDDRRQGLVGTLLVNPMGAPIQDHSFHIRQAGPSKLTVQHVAARVLTDDCEGRHFRQPRRFGVGGEDGVAIESFVVHECGP
jgi:hypothetical protein